MKGSGIVISINPGMIIIRNSDGTKMNLNTAPCSKLKATGENHVLVKDDSVDYEVNINQYGGYELRLLICYVWFKRIIYLNYNKYKYVTRIGEWV